MAFHDKSTLFSPTNFVTICTTKAYYLHTSRSPCGWTPRDTDRAQEPCVKDGRFEGPTRRAVVKENYFSQNLYSFMREILKYHVLFSLHLDINTLKITEIKKKKINEIKVKQKHTECLFLKNGLNISYDILRSSPSPSNSTSLDSSDWHPSRER